MTSELIWKALRGVQFSKEFKREELLSVKGRTKASIHGGDPGYPGGDGMQRVAGRRLGEALPPVVRHLRSNKWLLG